MPFKVTYNIWDSMKAAPIFSTSDKRLAQVELEDIHRKRGFLGIGMVPEVTPVDLTKPEEYVWLVYRVRKAIKKYYGEGRRHEDLLASLDLEKRLDDWNTRTRYHLQSHPKCKPDDPKAFAFFEVVEEWRMQWHNYFAYKKRADKDPAVEREMKKQCFDYEKEIDKYINLVIGL